MNQAAIAIDLGGTKCAGAIIDEKGKINSPVREPLDQRQGEKVGDLVADVAGRLLKEARAGDQEIKGIGISVPGISYQSSGKVWAPNIGEWHNFPLRDHIKIKLSLDKPVHIDSDRACSILGETWMGAARGKSHAIFIAVGTGIGAGIMANGTIIRGANDIAGATGWMVLESDFKEDYRKFGCFEYHASGDGLVREARDMAENTNTPLPTKMDLSALTAAKIFEAYENQDPLAEKVIKNAIIRWGKAVANYVSIFNPEVIVFGGGVFGPAGKLVQEITGEAKKWAQPISMQEVVVRNTELGDKAALLGAGSLILNQ